MAHSLVAYFAADSRLATSLQFTTLHTACVHKHAMVVVAILHNFSYYTLGIIYI
jgi:hypothetical protein